MSFCCSVDARRVFNVHPEMADKHRLEVEHALYTAHSGIVNQLMKKYDNPAKVIAMLKRGYVKIDRGIGVINWDKIIFHYYYLTERYLNKDFPYSHLMALNDIANFHFGFIDLFIEQLKVKNLFYIRKVLISESSKAQEDTMRYKYIKDIYIKPITDKGSKIDMGELKDYVK